MLYFYPVIRMPLVQTVAERPPVYSLMGLLNAPVSNTGVAPSVRLKNIHSPTYKILSDVIFACEILENKIENDEIQACSI